MQKSWSLSATQLKPLDAAALLLFALRNARRTAAWWRPVLRKRCEQLCDRVLSSAHGDAADATETLALARSVMDASALRVNRAAAREEAFARAANYAVSSLDAAVEASLTLARPARVKAVIQSAKYCASVALSLAHAGALRAEPGSDAVTTAGDAAWAAIHRDVALLAQRAAELRTIDDVDAIGPLWDGDPRWASPERLRR